MPRKVRTEKSKRKKLKINTTKSNVVKEKMEDKDENQLKITSMFARYKSNTNKLYKQTFVIGM